MSEDIYHCSIHDSIQAECWNCIFKLRERISELEVKVEEQKKAFDIDYAALEKINSKLEAKITELYAALKNSASDTCELHCTREKHGIDCLKNKEALQSAAELSEEKK